MRILLTGANGFIGSSLLPRLVELGHEVICCVRKKSKFTPQITNLSSIVVYEVDFLKKESISNLPKKIDIAYYLLHSMADKSDFHSKELACAKNFSEYMSANKIRQVIYLGSILNAQNNSNHLKSRFKVEQELAKGNYNFTALRAAIIIGNGSASLEIIKNLVIKLPIIFAPAYLNTKCQPIGINDTIKILTGCIDNENVFNNNFDIGGNEIISYKKLISAYAKASNLKRPIINIPVKAPFLSAFWLFLVSSVSYRLARSLVESVSTEFVCRNNEINRILNVQPQSIEESIIASINTNT